MMGKRFMRGTLFALLTGAAGLAAHGQVPAPQPPVQEVGIDQRLDEQIPPDIELFNEEGEAVQLGEYFGEKPVIFALVYFSCPSQCNLVLDGILQALRVLNFDAGEEFQVVTVSFDPSDTADVAKARKVMYSEMYGRDGADEGWHFLTGEQDQITALTEAVGFRYVYDENTEQFAHSNGIILATPTGRIAQYFYGLEYSPRDLRLAMVEASNERIGSVVDEILLLCYAYDPTTGQYGVVIMNIIRLAGGLTLLVLGGFVFMALRRERADGRSPLQPDASAPGQ